MAWDEWEQLKSGAAERRSAQMQLNQAAAQSDGGAGGGGELIAYQDDLGKVGNAALDLHGKLDKQADIAGMGMNKAGEGSTMQASAELGRRNFAMGDALSLTVEIWTAQVNSLLQACAHISNHLDFSKKRHAGDDAYIAASIRGRDGSAMPVSELNKYFK